MKSAQGCVKHWFRAQDQLLYHERLQSMLLQSYKVKEVKTFLKSGFSCLRNQVGLMTGSVDAPHACVTHRQALMRLASRLNNNRRVV